MTERAPFEQDLARLISACEAGLDLPGVLSAASAATANALAAGAMSVYSLSEDGAALTLLQGDGPAA